MSLSQRKKIIIALYLTLVVGLVGFWIWRQINTQSTDLLSISLGHYVDATAKLSALQIAALQQKGQFKNLPYPELREGYTEANHWIHFSTKTGLVPADLTFEIMNVNVNRLEMFEVRKGKIHSLGMTGDFFPFSQRPTPNRTFAYRLHLDAYENTEYYVMLDRRFEDLSTGFRLWKTTDFEQSYQRSYTLWGIFAGFVFLLLLINFIFWRVRQDTIYLWYNAYVATYALRQSTELGLAFQYFWPNLPEINQPEPLIQAVWLYIPAFMIFMYKALEIKTIPYQILKGVSYTTLCLFVLLAIAQFLQIPQQYSGTFWFISRVHTLLSTPILILFVWIIVEGYRSRNRMILYYNIAFTIHLLAQFFIVYQNVTRHQIGSHYFIQPYILLMIVFLIDVIIFSFMLGYRFSLSLRQHETLQLDLLKTQEEQQKRMIEALEAERQQITQDLQDDVGSTLSAAQFHLEHIPTIQQLRQLYPALITAQQLIDKGREDLRAVSHNLMPIEFAERGLAVSLATVVEQVSRPEGIQFKYEQKGTEKKMSTANEVQLYRIATELINNILKHSQAKEATIALRYETQFLTLIAQDNGKGFDTDELAQKGSGGIGVSNLYARAQHLHAEVNIDSGSKGTTVEVKIPMKSIT